MYMCYDIVRVNTLCYEKYKVKFWSKELIMFILVCKTSHL